MFNPLELTQKTYIITGASSGIGKETSIILSKLGARLILIARDEVRLQKTRDQLVGSDHKVYPFDLTRLEEIKTLIADIAKEEQVFSGLVHCAGQSLHLPIRNLKYEQIQNLMTINCLSFMEVVKNITKKCYFHPEGGSIVALSSIASQISVPALSAYSASKGALEAATRALALEYAPRKIRFNCVAPGWVKTEMAKNINSLIGSEEAFIKNVLAKHPLGIGDASDVALSVAFLLSSASKWITGSTLVVDGGYTAQ